MGIRYVFLCFFLFGLFSVSFAQRDVVLYNMESIPQQQYTNPSHKPSSLFYINLPVISSVYLDYHNNGFTFTDLIQKRADDSLVLNIPSLIGKLKENNLLGFAAQIDLLGAGFNKGKSHFFFNVSEKFLMRVRYPKDLVRLLWEGNAGFIGETAVLSGMAIKATHYREFAFGMGRELNEQWSIAGKLKILSGVQNISTNVSKLNITTLPNTYDLSGTSDMVINTSIIPDEDITAETYLRPKNKNWGAGIDLGATFKLNDKFTFSGSIVDLSFITWKHNVTNYSNNLDNATFNGNAINTFTDSTATTPFETLFDSLAITYNNYNETKNKYTEGIPPRIYLGGTYNINDNNKVGALFHGEYFKKAFYPSFTVSYNYKLPKWIGASLSYTAMHRSFVNLGGGLSLNLGPLQIYVVSDNLSALFNLAKITGGGVVPQAAKSMHARAGVNFVFNKKEQDKDKDGIINKEDECPNIPGLVEFNGCPDKDGDKIIDKYDDCPDTPGLAEFNGCPDKDGDKVIDKEDECPDTPGPIDNKGCPIKLHLMSADNDTLLTAEINDEGFFVFTSLPDKESYLFLLDAHETAPIEEVQIIIQEEGKESVITAIKVKENFFRYAKLPHKVSKLLLMNDQGDTLMQSTKNKEGFFVFEPLPADKGLLFRFDATEKELTDELLVVVIDSSGRESLITAIQDETDKFKYEYIPMIENTDLDLEEKKEVPVILMEEEEEIINTAFSNLGFNVGSSVITFGSYSSLGELSELLVKKPEWGLILSGHTDNVGSEKANLLLSKERAEAVKKVLVSRGVDGNRVAVKYFGESQPIASNETALGKQENRRVEMLIVEGGMASASVNAFQINQVFEEKGIWYRVQFLASSKKLEPTDSRLKGMEGVEVYYENGMYKYTVGRFAKLLDTSDMLSSILNNGFKQSFVVAFQDGNRIAVKDAIKISGK